MTGKRDHLYFELLQEGVRYAVEAAAQLQNDLEHFDASVLNQQIDTMHELEHQADLTKHQAMEKLIREFITPLEREDILGLTSAIDDVTDSIEDVLLRLYMFNIHELRPDALEFSRIVAQCCAALQDLMDEFPHFRKSKTIREKIIEINHLEEIGDRLFTRKPCTAFTRSVRMPWKSCPGPQSMTGLKNAATCASTWPTQWNW